jgi:uncharacterized protein
MPMTRLLSLLETRVIGVLLEKERTVPDSYPLTLNYLVSGCNQKSAREPVLEASDDEVQATVDSLKGLSLIIESSGGRVTRYEHNALRVIGINDRESALITALMLRGPQTVGELRINTERLYKFADITSVEGYLQSLAEREQSKGGPLTVKLPAGPRGREPRWGHLLCGPIELPAQEAEPANPAEQRSIAVSELAAMQARITQLERQVSSLQGTMKTLCDSLGVTPPAE